MTTHVLRLFLAVTLLLASTSLPGAAQPGPKPPLVGILAAARESYAVPYLEAGRRASRELGYVEGQNLAVEVRFVGGQLEKLPDVISELVALNPRVIVVMGDIAVRAIKQAGGCGRITR